MPEPYEDKECSLCRNWFPATERQLETEGFCYVYRTPDGEYAEKLRYDICDCDKFIEID